MAGEYCAARTAARTGEYIFCHQPITAGFA